ncbi:hypothetical protein [Rhodococcus koreensis]
MCRRRNPEDLQKLVLLKDIAIRGLDWGTLASRRPVAAAEASAALAGLIAAGMRALYQLEDVACEVVERVSTGKVVVTTGKVSTGGW